MLKYELKNRKSSSHYSFQISVYEMHQEIEMIFGKEKTSKVTKVNKDIKKKVQCK